MILAHIVSLLGILLAGLNINQGHLLVARLHLSIFFWDSHLGCIRFTIGMRLGTSQVRISVVILARLVWILLCCFPWEDLKISFLCSEFYLNWCTWTSIYHEKGLFDFAFCYDWWYTLGYSIVPFDTHYFLCSINLLPWFWNT